MRSYFVITLLIALATIIDGNILPDAFYGKFSLGNSENFDEYLAAKGVNWILRRLMSLMNMDVVFSMDDDVEGILIYKLEGDTLVLSAEAEGVVTKRYFKRQ
ncbi:hypothetical protein PRIPAC_96852 [Pristionchus pacificus]|uniref:FABP domain-containing protein n=1 Tax=Pristionchus pacificus TaxID=54126 RepID=A0A2A6B2Q9_PRIPA|nr:hypothetical protein PRIPAC_96852 [Pristionchus pacificus]|eukprot:PDM60159.1 hypothetical protein PRIPAC_53984 [Pristionchus pacificus]